MFTCTDHLTPQNEYELRLQKNASTRRGTGMEIEKRLTDVVNDVNEYWSLVEAYKRTGEPSLLVKSRDVYKGSLEKARRILKLYYEYCRPMK